MEKIGLTFHDVLAINPKIIYGVVTGYGIEGPWAHKPGQDLLIQSLSGLTWLSGRKSDGPVPFGLAVADLMCGNHLVQGILAALLKRSKSNRGVLVEVSLLESILDVQFEAITSFLNDGGQLPVRGNVKGSAHAFLGAPYGIYQTQDGFISLAMGDLLLIGNLLEIDLTNYADKSKWFSARDEIRDLINVKLQENGTANWLEILRDQGVWCEKILNYKDLNEESFIQDLHLKQSIVHKNGREIMTTRNPIRFDGEILSNAKAAPAVGEHNKFIQAQFLD
jgi:crotonobetainyl-CoA:carnitine CoA-transferase CaiB-like acyl-CoA transferase